MKIGIITLYGNFNFGNKLQNYGLQKFLMNNNIKSEIIKNELNSKNRIKHYINILKNMLKSLIIKLNINNINVKREKKFIDFNKEFLKISKEKQYCNLIKKSFATKYEYFFYGSDQVWNPNYYGTSKLYLGTFANKEKNVAFSASFGVKSLDEKYKKIYKNALKNFKAISLREDSGKKIVEALINKKNIDVLVDPTMLLTKKEWQEVAKKPINLNEKKYILNYFLGEASKKVNDNINEFAKKRGWDVINILDKNDPFYVSGPSEFVYLEQNAELICTNSFHACVFGILMNTPFIAIKRDGADTELNSRLETLLSKFKLEDRYYKDELNESSLQCDYSHCKEILNKERKKANEFLKKALNIGEDNIES